jgi:hypothetical protein
MIDKWKLHFGTSDTVARTMSQSSEAGGKAGMRELSLPPALYASGTMRRKTSAGCIREDCLVPRGVDLNAAKNLRGPRPLGGFPASWSNILDRDCYPC